MAINTTKFGEAEYPHLSIPDTHFKPEGEYHVKLKVKKEDAQEDIKKIREVISKEVAEEHKRRPNNWIWTPILCNLKTTYRPFLTPGIEEN